MLGRLGLRRQALFCNQLGNMLGAGIPMATALDKLATRGIRRDMRPMMRSIRADVANGASLSKAMENQGRRFPALMVTLTRVAEESGDLEGVLKRLARHYEFQRQITNRFLLQLVYPAFMVGMTIVVLTLLAYILTMLNENATTTPEAAAGKVFGTACGILACIGILCFLVMRVMAEQRFVQEM